MSAQTPAPPPPSPVLPRERATPLSNSLGDPPSIHPPMKKTIGKKKKAPKTRVTTRTKLHEPADAPQRIQYQYEPYRKADITPEPEGDRPASPEDLETLDATAKTLYRSDREALEYIEALNHRTAAILEHVNRTSSQLRSCDDVVERLGLFLGQLQKIDDQPANQLFRDDPFGEAWVDNEMIVLGSNEEGNVLKNPDLFPTLVYSRNGAFPSVEEHLSEITNRPNMLHECARGVFGKSVPQSPYNHAEGDLFRPDTPPARQPSLPPGHEDGNPLEYAEDMLEMRSDFSAPPNHAGLASDDSTFNRSGADLRITSDTGLLFPPSDQELARVSKEFKREATDVVAALAMRLPTGILPSRHPLTQSYIPSSPPGPILQPEPQHLVPPLPVLRTPPSRIVLNRKRKRPSTSGDEEDNDARIIAGPSAYVARFNDNVPGQVQAEKNGARVSIKRRRLLTRQPSWDSQVFLEADCILAPPRADPPIKEDSDIERSQVIAMLSQVVEQAESEGEREPTGIIHIGLEESQHSPPALTLDNGQTTPTKNIQSKMKAPTASQIPADASAPVPEDVFGPIVFSAKVRKISDRFTAEVFEKDVDNGIVKFESEREPSSVSRNHTRFRLDGRAKKNENKVFRKTPIRPGTLSRAIEAENALAAEIEAGSQDTLKYVPSPKTKRAVGARARKQKNTPLIEPKHPINSEEGLPSVSASMPPSQLRRGRSATAQPKVPLPKTPARKSTRSRKKI